jgi:hypothetical protein
LAFQLGNSNLYFVKSWQTRGQPLTVSNRYVKCDKNKSLPQNPSRRSRTSHHPFGPPSFTLQLPHLFAASCTHLLHVIQQNDQILYLP